MKSKNSTDFQNQRYEKFKLPKKDVEKLFGLMPRLIRFSKLLVLRNKKSLAQQADEIAEDVALGVVIVFAMRASLPSGSDLDLIYAMEQEAKRQMNASIRSQEISNSWLSGNVASSDSENDFDFISQIAHIRGDQETVCDAHIFLDKIKELPLKYRSAILDAADGLSLIERAVENGTTPSEELLNLTEARCFLHDRV